MAPVDVDLLIERLTSAVATAANTAAASPRAASLSALVLAVLLAALARRRLRLQRLSAGECRQLQQEQLRLQRELQLQLQLAHRPRLRQRTLRARLTSGLHCLLASASLASVPRALPMLDSPPFLRRLATYTCVRGKTLRVLDTSGVTSPTARAGLPTLCFLHGLGGHMAQFSELMQLFSGHASILSFDAVGHGSSRDTARAEDYSFDSLVDDAFTVICDRLHDASHSSPLVLVCHSYGCAIGTAVAARVAEARPGTLAAIVHMAPMTPATHGAARQGSWIRRAVPYLPAIFIDIARAIDTLGGANSNSVSRMLGPGADSALRHEQLRTNIHLTSFQLKYLLGGMRNLTPEEIAAVQDIPQLTILGECDAVCVDPYISMSANGGSASVGGEQPEENDEEDNEHEPHEQECHDSHSSHEINSGASSHLRAKTPTISPASRTVLPGVGHQVMLEAPELVHAVISAFLIKHCGLRALDPHAMLKSVPVSEKWSLKNAAKWAATLPVSDCIGGFPLRAMKVLREEDPTHSPVLVARKYPRVRLIVDLSRDPPPYDTEGLASLNIEYRKLSTTSKEIPSRAEVAEFVAVISEFLNKYNPAQKKSETAETQAMTDNSEVPAPARLSRLWSLGRYASEASSSSKLLSSSASASASAAEVAVHCHYGFNRTGFMIVCFLVEVGKFNVADAIALFAKARPPKGIRHMHFKDELYLRYALRRASTAITAGDNIYN